MNLRKIDALVAEHVMGWVVYFSDGEFVEKDGTPIHDWRGREGESSYRDFVPPYSTDIAAAWEVVKKLEDYDPMIFQYGVPDTPKGWLWFCDFEGTSATHENVATAICLAALQAKGIKIEE
jgi:hypothetical protein